MSNHHRSRICAVALGATLLIPTNAFGDTMPRGVGECAQAKIKQIGTRFGERLVKPKSDSMDAGTSVVLSNGVYGVSYSYVDAVAHSRVGDKVMTCLISLPKDCPKGDERGKSYATTNLRTRESWTLPDSQHKCGGA